MLLLDTIKELVDRMGLLQFQLPAVDISKHLAAKQFSIKCRTQGIYQT